ncbi:hypothetical protein [Lactococcus petauri]|nr:hypothetical protein [Lactococcus petauri]
MKIWTKLGLLAIVGLSLTACGGNAQNIRNVFLKYLSKKVHIFM